MKINRICLVVVIVPALGAILTVSSLFASAEAPKSSDAGAVRVDFSDSALGPPTGNFVAVALSGEASAKFHVEERHGRRVLTGDHGTDGDVLFYKPASSMPSIEESYSFVYSGPSSVVEPFIVNARPNRHNAVQGFTTNLAASHPGDNTAGNITYHYSDDAGTIRDASRGRLRTEPYFYTSGHTYRVDAIVDSVSGLLTTRVYDEALGPQAFDLRIVTKANRGFLGYPGIIARYGRVAVADFGFGPNGGLPVRPHPARRAADYLNYLGYNAAVIGPATSPLSLAFQRYFPQLLIKHVRLPDEARFLPSINAVSRYGIDADVLTGNRTTIDRLRTFIAALAVPPDSIELWNEPNNSHEGAAYDPEYASKLPSFSEQVVTSFPHIKIWGPSVLPNHGSASDVLKLSSLGSSITAWNAHSYTQGAPENLGYGGFFSHACGTSREEDCGWYGAPNFNDNLSALINPTLPGVTTEGAASYGSYPDICGHSNVDAATQQAYVERGMLYNYKLGHLRIYPYKFIDDGGCSDGGGTYGIMSKLIDAAGQPSVVPKPAYVSLVYFDHILADETDQAKRFDAQPLAYGLKGAQPDIEEVLLAEADGSYRLVLWSDAALWDFNANGSHAAGSRLPLVAEHVVVTFGKLLSATVYTQTPGNGAWALTDSARSTSVGVTVNQFPLVVAIAPATAEIRAVALPRAVPTPGPLETPRPLPSALPNSPK